jgi:hypothetical protein
MFGAHLQHLRKYFPGAMSNKPCPRYYVDMLQVRAESSESVIKKFRRNTCNGDQRLFGGNLRSAMIQRKPAITIIRREPAIVMVRRETAFIASIHLLM